MFTILCLLCLCRNREYPGNFQNKTVISKLFFQMSAQVKWEGRPLSSGQEAGLNSPLNYLLPTYRGNVNYYISVHLIPTLPMGTGSTLAIFKIHQWTLFSNEFSSCPNWRGQKGLFWMGARRGTTLPDYHLVDVRDEKVSPLVEFEIILPLIKLKSQLKRIFFRFLSARVLMSVLESSCQFWNDKSIPL